MRSSVDVPSSIYTLKRSQERFLDFREALLVIQTWIVQGTGGLRKSPTNELKIAYLKKLSFRE